jgi:EPS-associated MarR family transcriptional regulator
MKQSIKKKNEFMVLRVISSYPRKSQRSLANDLGFSLGKLNYCIQALKKKGWIKIKNFSKKKNKLDYIYLVTPKGIYHKTKMAYFFMKQIMKEYEDLKTETKKK